ncbi:hypothetical protein [Robertkochia aurantiaca]|uniref:hypothetical protein n=1 Tax=Robertkochia aurantiaca TaxID=2873700 RepID=UPI001CCCDCFF|nr:hypothetical protein [Robertkochia sp. 3YJGBD-33]
MKNLFLFIAFLSISTLSLSAQKNLNISVQGSLPFPRETNNLYTHGIEAGISYHTYVYENLMLGGSTGYGQLFGETIASFTDQADIVIEDYSYIPVLVSAKVYAVNQLFLNLQPGYAFALGDDLESSFMFRANAGYNLIENLDLFLSYQFLLKSEEPMVGLGLNFYP